METENRGKPMSGCLKIVLISASFIVIIGIIAYFAVWRVPYNKGEVTRTLNEIDNKVAFYRSVPPDNNGWSDYKKALDSINFKDPSNPNSSLQYNLSGYTQLGVPGDKADDIDEFLENNQGLFKDIDPGFQKNYVIDEGLLSGDFRNATKSTQNIEPMGEFLVLCGDRETDLMQVSRRYLQAIHLTSNTIENLAANRSNTSITAIKRLRWMLNVKDPDKETCRYLTVELTRLSSQRSRLADKMRMYLLKMEGIKKSFSNMSSGPIGPFLTIYMEREMQIIEMTFIKLINAFDKSEVEGFKEFAGLKSKAISTSYNYIIPPLKDEFKIFAIEEVYSKGMIIAAALKLYKAEKGKYPENIESLIPGYLKVLPYDNFSIDKKFTYIVREKGNVILYSVGIDGKNDNGKEFEFDSGTGDLIILDTQSPPSSDIRTSNIQPLWSVNQKVENKKDKKTDKKVEKMIKKKAKK